MLFDEVIDGQAEAKQRVRDTIDALLIGANPAERPLNG